MSQENNNFKFNTELLMNDVNNVIQNGINNLLSDFITNYKLYEETHNCIMNLPSIKREFAKKKIEEGYDYLMDYSSVKTQFSTKNEAYDDLPDLISVSSDENVKGIEESFCDNYTRIPIEEVIEEVIEDDSDQESDDTILCMKKIANQLLKEKEDTYALFQKETNSYKEIIENCYKEIENLKNEINELKNSSIVCDLTVDGEDTQELIVEIKQEKEEKENIVLHMEEQSGTEEEEETDSEVIEEDDSESVEEEEHDSEVVEEAESEVVEEDDSEVVEEEEHDSEVVEEEEEQEKSDVETEKSDEDTVETEKSDEKDFVEEEEELIEIEIDDVTYCTNDENNGLIYELDKDGNVGETVGYLKDGEPFFN